MQPINTSQPLYTIFETDEDIQRDFESIYESAKRTFFNYGALSSKEIRSLFQVDRDTSDRIMDKIKAEFLAGILK